MNHSASRIIKARSPAKLNLTFEIKGLLPGGYHSVETLMQAIDLEDELTLTIDSAEETSVVLTCVDGANSGDFPLNDSNLIVKAAKLFVSALGGQPLAIKAQIKKKIPIAAGMGGGSSNAAATLVALNNYMHEQFSLTELQAMASHLGADVPFCVVGGTQVGRSRGDDLTEVKSAKKLYFTVVKVREFSISTEWIYKQYDQALLSGAAIRSVSLRDAITAVQNGRVDQADQSFVNAFEPIVYARFGELEKIRRSLLRLGAGACFMTGSGPTLVALSKSMREAEEIRQRLLALEAEQHHLWHSQQPISLDVWTAESIQHGAKVVESLAPSLPN